METFVSALLLICATFLTILVGIFVIEVIAATVFARRYPVPKIKAPKAARRPLAVLIPAHNESRALLPTLQDIKLQLQPGDGLLVVADNCTDDTANVALAAGADVVERDEPTKRGKGYALHLGLRYLSSAPPEIVIVVDADCRLADDALDELAKTCIATHRPVQALYLMTTPAESQINQRVAEFAWRVKNWLRPSGLKALGLPCQLMGAGMAFPWEVIYGSDLANGCLVEDLKLGLDLAANGFAPVFCPTALVTSQFASTRRAARTQRERWEGGHIGMITSAAPRFLLKATANRNWNLLALTLDLAVPPLTLLALLASAIFVGTAFYAIIGFSSRPVIISAAGLVAFVAGAFLAWMKCGRDVVPVAAFFSIPLYILQKLGLYRGKLIGKADASWIRTDRANSE